MRDFHFVLREITERDAIVQANSVAEARDMLLNSYHNDRNIEPEGVILGDLQNVSITLRSVQANYLVEKVVDVPEDLSYPSRIGNESGDRP